MRIRRCYRFVGRLPPGGPLGNLLAKVNPKPRPSDFNPLGFRSGHASFGALTNFLSFHFRQGREQGQQNIAAPVHCPGQGRLRVGVEDQRRKSSAFEGAQWVWAIPSRPKRHGSVTTIGNAAADTDF
jgi:hypothetical protein